MASASSYYPDGLNPFGSDDEDVEQINKEDDYPDYLSPFGEDSGGLMSDNANDYDNSLNPFGEEEEESDVVKSSNAKQESQTSANDGNPFGDEEDDELEEQAESTHKTSNPVISITKQQSSPQPESLDGPPPVPLPRTKSLLKKEQAQRNKQLKTQLVNDSSNLQTASILTTTPSTSSSSITTTTCIPVISNTSSFQKKKNKRNAPPVPVNFKRQVSGSLDAIEDELNDIGDRLAIIEKESIQCQEDLKAAHEVDESKFSESKNLYSDLIKRKNVISRRQKELMYRKRELKLDQIHSDIEYELRMIGNKQLSHRTADDEAREKELLKKLVEIVEEKSDIVENLNKDTSCDNYDIEEALRRLNLSKKSALEESEIKGVKGVAHNAAKNGNCDKVNTAIGNKLSKIATLLPKGGTIKGTIKIKRKRLFKKGEPRSIER